MNNVDFHVPYDGRLLTDNVNMDWMQLVEPRYFDDFIKFVVNVRTNQVWMGMEIHADCVADYDDYDNYYGGNIFFADGHIEYESTLNVEKNEAIGKFGENMRLIVDEELINRVNNVLFAWVSL